ncbi:helix-turn-helix domain-containing protein [Meiothermus cerbereus]|uniref:helix-turn-helix domain-containing protein n=1 Tax=Meiothermus cerbereus TaxID=65552 RepID=UPI000A0078C9
MSHNQPPSLIFYWVSGSFPNWRRVLVHSTNVVRLRAYRYRLYPAPAQAEFLARQFGCVRYVYNWGLEQKSRRIRKAKREYHGLRWTSGSPP